MKSKNKELRKIVQEALGYNDSAPLDWSLFEEFGLRILRSASYNGDANDILRAVKQSVENEGWEFDDPFDHYMNK